MKTTTSTLMALLALGSQALAALQTCGASQYDPTQYVCYYNSVLCPITAGEPLSYCNGACYSKYQYTCTNNALAQLPRYDGPFTLTVSNPSSSVNGWPVTASDLHWWVGGATASYCPDQVKPNCPTGDITAMYAGSAMDVEVPGGQQYYLDAYWNVDYTQAHSASIPSGSVVGGFAAYQNGAFVNINTGALGWVACPSTAMGGGTGDKWNLVSKNATNAWKLNGCTDINLMVQPLPSGTVGAWQYT